VTTKAVIHKWEAGDIVKGSLSVIFGNNEGPRNLESVPPELSSCKRHSRARRDCSVTRGTLLASLVGASSNRTCRPVVPGLARGCDRKCGCGVDAAVDSMRCDVVRRELASPFKGV
jgi:hypothetical protein